MHSNSGHLFLQLHNVSRYPLVFAEYITYVAKMIRMHFNKVVEMFG